MAAATRPAGRKRRSNFSQFPPLFFLFNSLKPGPSGQVRDIRLSQLFDLIVHFFARPKKRTKKTTPVAFGPADFFALLKAAGNFQTRFAQTVKIPLSASFPVLNKCQREIQ
ncbi:MAG: hypothetical protein SCH71_13760 [Desulfobulbaceae bacterium]|nr:hypothetical protein [Desulfobulbaceae bacterium]